MPGPVGVGVGDIGAWTSRCWRLRAAVFGDVVGAADGDGVDADVVGSVGAAVGDGVDADASRCSCRRRC